jgi:hypothetical protein
MNSKKDGSVEVVGKKEGCKVAGTYAVLTYEKKCALFILKKIIKTSFKKLKLSVFNGKNKVVSVSKKLIMLEKIFLVG